MSRRNNALAAFSMLALAGLTAPAAIAGSASVSGLSNSDWRAIFQSAAYNNPCPLVVYGDDLSGMATMRRAAPSPVHVPAIEQRASAVVSDILHDYLRGADFVGNDGLAAYSEDLSRAGKL